MKGTDIVTVIETQEWLHIDYTDSAIEMLIQSAFDWLNDGIDDFENKLKSAKFKRKLKLPMLNFIVSNYDEKGMVTDKIEKYKYMNQSVLRQLQYNLYLEGDL